MITSNLTPTNGQRLNSIWEKKIEEADKKYKGRNVGRLLTDCKAPQPTPL
jgi:hypothetical protein